jgi:arylsulfatase A-like enzyme
MVRGRFIICCYSCVVHAVFRSGIDLRMATLGDKLKAAGYHNVLIGKTHWGVATTHHLPFNRGWQFHLGYLGGGASYSSGHECASGDGTVNCHNYSVGADSLDLWHNDRPAEAEYLNVYSTDLYSRLAVEVIQQHAQSAAAGPLWLHLNYQAVHNPYTSPPGEPTCGNDKSQVFAQVLERMDAGIANVTAALKASGMWSSTLVLFFGDNGGTNAGNNFPLRVSRVSGWFAACSAPLDAHLLALRPLMRSQGSKYKAWEGGLRVSASARASLVPTHASSPHRSLRGSRIPPLLSRHIGRIDSSRAGDHRPKRRLRSCKPHRHPI